MREYHQYGIRHRLSGGNGSSGLFGDKRSDRILHPGAVQVAFGKEYPGQRSRSGTDLDSAHPGILFGGKGGKVRSGRADAPCRPAMRTGSGICISCVRRFVLCDRAGDPCERRDDHWELRGRSYGKMEQNEM